MICAIIINNNRLESLDIPDMLLTLIKKLISSLTTLTIFQYVGKLFKSRIYYKILFSIVVLIGNPIL